MEAVGEFDGMFSIERLTDHVHIWLGREELPHRVPHKGVIIDHQDTHRTCLRVHCTTPSVVA